MNSDQRIDRVRQLYDRSVFFGDSDALAAAEHELDAVEADLALARGKIIHGRFLERRMDGSAGQAEDPAEIALFERAAELYKSAGDLSGEAESLFWIGCFYQIVRRDAATAASYLGRSSELSALTGDKLTRSDALRLMGTAEHMAGRTAVAKERLEESTQLRREIGWAPGVASNLVGLAYVAAGLGELDGAVSLLDEADAIVRACGATAVARLINQARKELAEKTT
jgi:hypothetical protein